MTRINFHSPEEITREIRARGDLSESLRECLGRYFYLLSRGRAELADVFTADELTALCAVANGTVFAPHNIEGLRWNFAPHNIEGLRWNIEGSEPGVEIQLTVEQKSTLIAKLNAMPLHQHAALVDAVERFWRAISTGMQINPATILFI